AGAGAAADAEGQRAGPGSPAALEQSRQQQQQQQQPAPAVRQPQQEVGLTSAAHTSAQPHHPHRGLSPAAAAASPGAGLAWQQKAQLPHEQQQQQQLPPRLQHHRGLVEGEVLDSSAAGAGAGAGTSHGVAYRVISSAAPGGSGVMADSTDAGAGAAPPVTPMMMQQQQSSSQEVVPARPDGGPGPHVLSYVPITTAPHDVKCLGEYGSTTSGTPPVLAAATALIATPPPPPRSPHFLATPLAAAAAAPATSHPVGMTKTTPGAANPTPSLVPPAAAGASQSTSALLPNGVIVVGGASNLLGFSVATSGSATAAAPSPSPSPAAAAPAGGIAPFVPLNASAASSPRPHPDHHHHHQLLQHSLSDLYGGTQSGLAPGASALPPRVLLAGPGEAPFAAAAAAAGAGAALPALLPQPAQPPQPLPVDPTEQPERAAAAAAPSTSTPLPPPPQPAQPSRTKTIAVASHCPPELQPQPPGASWSIEDFALLRKLYEGALSVVCQAQHRRSGRHVALKIYKRSRLHEMERFQLAREICLHIRIVHPHVVGLFAAWKDSKYVYLALEWAPRGNAFDFLVGRGGRLGEEEAARVVMRPLLAALAFLHCQNFIHRDIKLENLLLDGGCNLKLADFGLAIDRKFEQANTRLGTFGYFAPEVLDCPLKKSPFDLKDAALAGYDSRVDVWSAGVVGYEVLSGRAPFSASSPAKIIQAIRTRELEYPDMSPEARDFLSLALTRDPAARPSAKQLLTHPWIVRHCGGGSSGGMAAGMAAGGGAVLGGGAFGTGTGVAGVDGRGTGGGRRRRARGAAGAAAAAAGGGGGGGAASGGVTWGLRRGSSDPGCGFGWGFGD
ncbi:hypothetical protein Agub_g10901, partial [Astrephomene gubernaculifera]